MNHSDAADALSYILKGTKMGCDIHWHSETKKDGKWICDQAVTFARNKNEEDYPEMDDFPGCNRDYWFFGLIQGVRSEWDWSFPERIVIPDDLSKEVQIVVDHQEGDSHSHGYLTREELKVKLEELKPRRAEQLIASDELNDVLQHHVNRLEEVINNMNSDVPDTDQRIVFWFDN